MSLELEILFRLLFFWGLAELHFYQLYKLNILFQDVKINIRLVVNEGLLFEYVVLNY